MRLSISSYLQYFLQSVLAEGLPEKQDGCPYEIGISLCFILVWIDVGLIGRTYFSTCSLTSTLVVPSWGCQIVYKCLMTYWLSLRFLARDGKWYV